ncbi:hypothetical protein BDQ17DRAFT_1351207 [Cyathus striatus]|nr:hypothetical protein BDQ17DRAFT_1351207 [Cyathus striatus]
MALEQQNQANPLSLPVPTDAPNTAKLDVNSKSIALDELGPMVVNSDGTLSRIANWPNMTEAERRNTLRVLSARNKLRIAKQERKQDEEESPAS